MAGWIKLHRSLEAHWLSDNPERLGAWVTLLLMANHKDREILLGAKIVLVKRGSFISSQRKLREKLGWSREKFEGFLALLKTQKMVTYETTHQYTHINITNYDTYQSLANDDTHTNTHTNQHTEPHTNTHTTDTRSSNKQERKKDKKERREEGKIRNPLTPFEGDPVWPTQIDTPTARAEWNRWLTYKHAKRSVYKTLDSHEAALRRCAKQFQTPERMIAAIEFSISQGWSGIFEEKKNQGGKKPNELSGVVGPNGYEYSEAFLYNMERVKKLREEEDEKSRT